MPPSKAATSQAISDTLSSGQSTRAVHFPAPPAEHTDLGQQQQDSSAAARLAK